MDDSSLNTSRMVSFLFEGDETVTCEVCLEPFQPSTRPPKILPCGHNFCAQCLFSICCHQEYYLLDSINCPTCRRSFSTNTAKNAPTNYDLCKILESVQRGNITNVTVIHVPDNNAKEPEYSKERRDTKRQSGKMTPQIRRLAEEANSKQKLRRCADCNRKLNSKNLTKHARFCENCTRSGHLAFSCLECCVNSHNGHNLVSISELETMQLQVLSEVRGLRAKILDASEQFDSRLSIIQSSGNDANCPSVVANKKNVLSESLDSVDTAIARLESNVLHSSTELRNIRNAQYSHFARVGKMCNLLEKCAKTDVKSRTKCASRLNSFSSTSQLRQAKLTVRNDDSLTKESIASLIAVLPSDELVNELKKALHSISPRDTVEERKRVYMRCATILTEILYDDIDLGLFMFADALLNCFYQLHVLSRKTNDFGRETKKISRPEIWKQVQFAYTELLRIAAKQFPAYHPERVDVIDDLAYVCRLYADVCDQASVTICMIEAARARASESNLPESEKLQTHQRLKLIDEHLMECRRVQKLQELRTTRTKKDGRMKRLFTSCFRSSVHS